MSTIFVVVTLLSMPRLQLYGTKINAEELSRHLVIGCGDFIVMLIRSTNRMTFLFVTVDIITLSYK